MWAALYLIAAASPDGGAGLSPWGAFFEAPRLLLRPDGGAPARPAPQRPAAAARPLEPVPSDAECGPLPPLRRVPFTAGEELVYDVDVMTARAGTVSLTVLPRVGRGPKAEIPIRARAASNTFFSKIRRVKAQALSFLSAADLRPKRYEEDALEDEVRKKTRAVFVPNGQRGVVVDWQWNEAKGQSRFSYARDGLDLVGAVYALRSIELAKGQSLCFDLYAARRQWRVWGTVSGPEQVSTPIGPHRAFHLAGQAARHDLPTFRRVIHIWVSDDRQRLPLAALGEIDLGAIRATLVRVAKREEPKGPVRREDLDW